MSFFKSLVQRGGGISSKTISWTPFDSKTKTPEAKNAPQALRGGEKHPEPPKKIPAPPNLSSGGNQIKQDLLDRHNQKNGMVATLKNPGGYLKLLENEKYFTQKKFSRNGYDLDTLKAQLVAVNEELAGKGQKLPDQVVGAHMTVLTQAIAAACKGLGNPIAEGARGLACLRNLNLIEGIRDPEDGLRRLNLIPQEGEPRAVNPRCPNVGQGLHENGIFDREDLACAWRIAQKLEMTPSGFATLKAITNKSAPPDHAVCPDVAKSVAKHDDVMLHVYLQASREKIKEAKTGRFPADVKADPYSLQRYLDENANRKTLLHKGLEAVQAHLKASHDHVNNPQTAKTPFQAPRTTHEWAIGAIRNGVYTDDLKDEKGNPTLFAKMQGRADKLRKWISRSTGEKVKTGKSWKRTFKQFFAPQVDKSPFNAYNRLGSGDKGVSFKNVEEGGIGEGRAIKEGMMLNLAAVLRKVGAGGQPLFNDEQEKKLLNLNEETLRNAVRLAVLEIMTDKDGNGVRFLPRYTRADPLDELLDSKIKARVKEWLPEIADENQKKKIDLSLKDLIDENIGPLTPDVLVGKWASAVGGPKSIDEAVEWASKKEGGPESTEEASGSSGASLRDLFASEDSERGSTAIPEEDGVQPPPANTSNELEPNWRAFGMAVKRAVNGEAEHAETPHFKDPSTTPKEVADVIESVIQHQELGSRATLYSGGAFGVGTKGLSESILGLPFAWLFRPRVDLRGERTRYATLEFGTGTQGNELFLGTQRIQKAQGGVGAFLGLGKFSKNGAKFGAGAGGDAAASYEGVDQRGVLFRLPRIETGVNGDAENNKKLGRIFRRLADPPPDDVECIKAPGEDGKSSLKNLWQEWPELSIGMVGLKDHAGRGGGSVYGGAGVGYDKFAAHLTAGVGFEGKKSANTWKETGGALHVSKKVSSLTAKVNVGGIVAVLTSFVNAYNKTTTEIVNGQAQEHTALEINQNFPLGDLLTGSADVWKTGVTRKDIFIEQDGELHKTTFRTVTYANAASFVAAVAPRLDKIAEQKAEKYEKERYFGTSQGTDTAPLTTEQHRERNNSREAVLKREHTILSQHLAASLKNAAPTQSFQEYFELTEAALAMANGLKSVEVMASEFDDTAAAKDCHRAIKEMVENDEAWETAFLVDNEAVSEQRTRGVNFVAKYQQVDGIIKTNMRTFN